MATGQQINTTLQRRAALLALLQQHIAERVAAGASLKDGLEEQFAARLQVSKSLLSHLKGARPISDKMARQVEAACDKPAGWLDAYEAPATSPGPAEEAFLALCREAWRTQNAQGKRALRTAVMGFRAKP